MGVKIHEDTLNYIDDLGMVLELNKLQQYSGILLSEKIKDVETLCLMTRHDLEQVFIEVITFGCDENGFPHVPDDIHMFLKIIGAFINQNHHLGVGILWGVPRDIRVVRLPPPPVPFVKN